MKLVNLSVVFLRMRLVSHKPVYEIAEPGSVRTGLERTDRTISGDLMALTAP
jgi:hypothetical protein